MGSLTGWICSLFDRNLLEKSFPQFSIWVCTFCCFQKFGLFSGRERCKVSQFISGMYRGSMTICIQYHPVFGWKTIFKCWGKKCQYVCIGFYGSNQDSAGRSLETGKFPILVSFVYHGTILLKDSHDIRMLEHVHDIFRISKAKQEKAVDHIQLIRMGGHSTAKDHLICPGRYFLTDRMDDFLCFLAVGFDMSIFAE